jgi:predicted ferric reductase
MKKLFLFLAVIFLIGILLFFWYEGSGELFSNGWYGIFLALGRLSGLVAVFSALIQLILIGRVRWIESLFGFDKLSHFHHWNGILTFVFILAHPFFITTAYGGFSNISFLSQTNDFIFKWDEMISAYIAFFLFVGLVVLSFTLIKSKLKYELWHLTHLGMYVAIALAFGHQVEKGGDFQGNIFFTLYWYFLYIFAFGNLLYFRFFLPPYLFWKHRFFVDHIVRENDSCVSIFIGGRKMKEFNVQPGQFAIFHFLSKGFLLDAHPFSFSTMRTGSLLRVTIKDLGDFTRRVSEIPSHTPVIIDGPHGIFTPLVCKKEKVLFIAGGVGITPILPLIEFFLKKKNMTLLWGNREWKDIIFKNELDVFLKDGLRMFHILSNDVTWNGERGFIDKEKILRLVPDVREREIYLCGPSPMMKKVSDICREIDVPEGNIHYERFSF